MRAPRVGLAWAKAGLVALCGLSSGHATLAASPTALQDIEPSSIALGESARLTITAIGDEAPSITAPTVAGLEFVAVGQSQQVQMINGVTTAKTTVTYQVTAQQAGVFTIPGALPGAEPVILTVNRNGSASGAVPAVPGAPAPPSGASADAARQGASGAAFVRLRLAKHELYVGEMIPVDIQVGARDGMVASLNGPPTLHGDAFTLNKLPENPVRTEEIIDGKPFIVFTWRTALVAVKPGSLSLTIDTPLTVRVQTPSRPGAGFFNGSGFEDLFNDPAFQNFFGRSVQRDVTVSSAPETFTVLALPEEGRPANFEGAVGSFKVDGDVAPDKAAEGDPITLRLRISGEGDFARVSSSMLHDGEDWKAYSPTSKFQPADEIGYRGEKTFEQPLIATRSGERTVPEVGFSWFDPSTRRYVAAHTQALRVSIAPVAGDRSSARIASAGPAQPAAIEAAPEWRPDHPDEGGGRQSSLLPKYFQPAYLIAPPLVLAALAGLWLWTSRRRRPARSSGVAAREPRIESLAAEMDGFAAAGDARSFFQAARQALSQVLGIKWGLPSSNITYEEVVSRLGSDNELSRTFLMADEAAYARPQLSTADYRRWAQTVLRYVGGAAP